MSKTFNYEDFLQQGFYRVVHNILKHVSTDGLPGNHHFYITFCTDFPGVDIPGHLLESYPEEMTIILQHEFWDLRVEEHYFSVTLSFYDSSETIQVPYHALIEFSDPSEQFVLSFKPKPDLDVPLPEPRHRVPSDKNLPDQAETNKVIALDTFRRK